MTGAPSGPSGSHPLLGVRVVVTRPSGQSNKLDRLLTDLGATVVALPTIEIADPASYEPLDTALRKLGAGAYEWIVFLSVNAVHQVFRRLFDLSAAGTLAGCRVACVGGATAEALAGHGVGTDLVPAISTAGGVAEALGAGDGRILVPRAAGAPGDALDELRSRGWVVEEVIAYRTVTAAAPPQAETMRKREFDVITFTSGSTVRSFSSMVTAAEAGVTPADRGERRVVCIGPVTAQAAGELGFRVDAVADEQSTEGLARAVVELPWG
ncbi:MAG: uroporphyrinogen-III synthase [Actinomycetota bacterium]|nr:uroporphyrinogen-III synthase [Actinomycetota bacterium]